MSIRDPLDPFDTDFPIAGHDEEVHPGFTLQELVELQSLGEIAHQAKTFGQKARENLSIIPSPDCPLRIDDPRGFGIAVPVFEDKGRDFSASRSSR